MHEWLVGWGGSESVLQSFAAIHPGAPIHTLVHAPDERVAEAFAGRDVRTTILQRVPGIARRYPLALPLMPWAWRGLDLADFDLVLTSSHSMAKSVRSESSARHVCYCHTPPRYLWDLVDEYRGGVGALLRGPLLARLRASDLQSAAGVDAFIANSAFVAERIRRIYGRESVVIHPPVDLPPFVPPEDEGDYFLAGGRLVPYKRVELVVEAANRAGLPLVVFGDGSERARLERLAGRTVRFTGRVDETELDRLIRGCRAYLFPGIEDFGILPVEVQARGRPVVALGEGGVCESVIDGVTGVLYERDARTAGPSGGDRRAVEALVEAVRAAAQIEWDPAAIRHNAERFSRKIFEDRIRDVLGE